MVVSDRIYKIGGGSDLKDFGLAYNKISILREYYGLMMDGDTISAVYDVDSVGAQIPGIPVMFKTRVLIISKTPPASFTLPILKLSSAGAQIARTIQADVNDAYVDELAKTKEKEGFTVQSVPIHKPGDTDS